MTIPVIVLSSLSQKNEVKLKQAGAVERDLRAGPGRAESGVVGTDVIQITPQMRMLARMSHRGG
jgi:hypothetical protein